MQPLHVTDANATRFDIAPQHGPRPLPLFLALLRNETAASPDRRARALAGLDRGETITWPSVADEGLWVGFEQARGAIIAASQTRKPAPRYVA